jgi:hypothetical protein
MVRRSNARPKVGDTVRVPWGLGTVAAEVVDVRGPSARPHAVVSVPVLGSSGEVLDRTTVSFPMADLEPIKATVIRDEDVSPPGMDGWMHRYWILVDDEEVVVEVWCSRTAEAMASYNTEIQSVVIDRGRARAIKAAKNAQPGRASLITINCDSSGVSVAFNDKVRSAP